ncbi:MAG: hypothetical protein D8M58_04870 [Calditrichaeota bacterium]|nr:MAG: hypothetical protein DWQ03_02205 [Calditrichota bacterium]MBL1204705.1 hypothetical protein [Calditrichota bacterium]NOG44533.1 hypothetical protein [Calditrichota bacterium]
MRNSLEKKTSPWIIFITVLFITVSFYSCNDRVNSSDTDDSGPVVNPIGKKNYFEIATWNIEWFPKSNSKTINLVKDIIRDLDLDMIAVQEISDVASFNTLSDSLDGWKGILSTDQYSSNSYQKTGILYKSDFISISSVHNIFENDSYPFPRPPLSAFVEIKDINGTQYDFSIIVLHLKAFSDESSEQRRREAIIKLEDFVSQEINNGADADFIVLGDWNDRVSDTGSNNVFLPFLDKNNQYSFVTDKFTTAIDHIMITNNSQAEFGDGETEMLDLRKELSNYSSDVSDHLPVMARFKGFTISTTK